MEELRRDDITSAGPSPWGGLRTAGADLGGFPARGSAPEGEGAQENPPPRGTPFDHHEGIGGPGSGFAGMGEDLPGKFQGPAEPALVQILTQGEVGNVREGLCRAERVPGEFQMKAAEIPGPAAQIQVDHRADRAEGVYLSQAQPQGSCPFRHPPDRLQHLPPGEGQGPGRKDGDVGSDEGVIGIVGTPDPVGQAGYRGGDRKDDTEDSDGPGHRHSCSVDTDIS